MFSYVSVPPTTDISSQSQQCFTPGISLETLERKIRFVNYCIKILHVHTYPPIDTGRAWRHSNYLEILPTTFFGHVKKASSVGRSKSNLAALRAWC